MVSSFSNPGFPPAHTHPPTFSFVVATNEDSLHETLDALFAPYLAKIHHAHELALSGDRDSTLTPMFAISDEGVFDPAPMISDDAAAIDPEINGWVNMYEVGKLVMVLNAEKVFDELAKRQSKDATGNLFDRMTPFFHNMVVCSQFCITEGEFWNVWDPGGRLAKILGVMLCSKHQENHCEKSFIDAARLGNY
ncbi:hypothetical protein ACFX15_022340 [Malus domestica]